MDKFWEKNSKSTEEIKKIYAEKVSVALEKQKVSESKVMRLNDKETRLIHFLRHTRLELLVSELKDAFANSVNKADLLNLRRMTSILEDRKVLDLNTLINIGVLTKEQADYLIRCMNENKNIIITGKLGVGKTTLLNSLLDYLKDVQTVIIERVKELSLSEEMLSKNVVIIEDSKDVGMHVMTWLNDNENSRLVIGEIQNSNEGFGLVSALNMGASILGTTWCQGNWREEFLNLFNGKMKEYAEETLSKFKFVQVNMSINHDNKRIVDKIEEI